MNTSYDNTNSFYSQKNKGEIHYRNERELKLITMFESDSSIQKYEMFLLPIMDNRTFQPKEEAIGFILHKEITLSYVLVSEYLAGNPNYANQIKKLITKGKGYGQVTILRKGDISGNLNVSHIK